MFPIARIETDGQNRVLDLNLALSIRLERFSCERKVDQTNAQTKIRSD